MESILEELECPICLNYLIVPIRQCMTGHNVCGKCMNQLKVCAFCRSEFSQTRNFTLESLILKMKYPCSNDGCTEMLTYWEREKHMDTCKFRIFPIRCAMRNCNFAGKKESLKNHWRSKHSNLSIFQTNNSSYFMLRNNYYFVNLVEGFGQMFWYKCKAVNNTMLFTVQFIGKVEEAKDYYFEIKITKPGTLTKKIIISDHCKSVELLENDLFKDDECCSLGFGYLSQFSTNNEVKYALSFCRYKDGPKSKKSNYHIQGGKKNLQTSSKK